MSSGQNPTLACLPFLHHDWLWPFALTTGVLSLIGVFDLLADARAQVHSVAAYLDALRDFWVAQADLDLAMVSSPSLSAPSGGSGPALPASGTAPH